MFFPRRLEIRLGDEPYDCNRPIDRTDQQAIDRIEHDAAPLQAADISGDNQTSLHAGWGEYSFIAQ